MARTQERSHAGVKQAHRLTQFVLNGQQEYRITMAERIYLLAHTNSGWQKSGEHDLETLLLWGLLLELIQDRRVKTHELTPRSNTITASQRYGLDVLSDEPTGDSVATELLQQIIHLKKFTNVKRIESIMATVKVPQLKKKIALAMVEKGLLSKHKILGTFAPCNQHIKKNTRTDICELLTCLEDRLHDKSASTFDKIRGFTPAMFSIIGLMYYHQNVLYTEVLSKHFVRNLDARAVLKHSPIDMLAMHSCLGSDLYVEMYNVLKEHGIKSCRF
jgi:hypothetical protein